MQTYYSLKTAVTIPNNADLNDYDKFGNYICTAVGISSTLSNCPHKTSGFMLHVERMTSSENSNIYVKQRMICNLGSCVEYWRTKVDGEWRPWYKIVPTAI